MQTPISIPDTSSAQWHAMTSQEVLQAFNTSSSGVSSEDAVSRLVLAAFLGHWVVPWWKV